MTTPQSANRRRRRTAGLTNIPREVVEWFQGLRTKRPPAPWGALMFPGYVLLPDWWAAWLEEHPDATPPASHAWLGDPTHSRNCPKGHALEVLAAARALRGLRHD